VTASATGTVRARFADVIGRAGALATALRGLGVAPGDRVATFMWNSQDHLEAYLAVPAAGAVLHTLNVRLSTEELTAIGRHAGDTVVIVGHNLVDRFAPVLAGLPDVHAVVVAGAPPGADLAGLAAVTAARVVRGDDLLSPGGSFDWDDDPPELAAAAMCYTSGTTGMPKGVVYSHRSTVLHAMSVCTGNAVGMTVADRALVLVPMFHANAWGWPYAALMAGTDLLFTDGDLSPQHIARVIRDERVTITGGVPTLWSDLLARPSSDVDLSSLRFILCGGSAVPQALIDAYAQRFGVTILPAWGMTEISPLGSVARPSDPSDPASVAAAARSQGRLLYGIEGRLVADNGAPAPWDGVSQGELQVRGPWVTGAYYGGAGADTFTADGWMRTGDLGTLDGEGVLRLADRRKDVIKSGGEWISSVALEDALIAHPEVADAAVIGVVDERWGERPLAVVALRPGVDGQAEALRSWVATRVARWWAPERWAFVDAVPRTSVGKADKVRLRAMAAAGELKVERVDP
jgi:acyl-CoA synthetase (AMP-forming)/AMP-acid ligase II